MIRRRRVLAVAICSVLLVIAVLVQDQLGAGPAPDRPAPNAVVEKSPERAALGEPDLAPVVGTVQRASAADPLDGRRWSDLLAPVDAIDGESVSGAFVVLVNEVGARRAAQLDDFVLVGDLDGSVFAALDSPLHCPRCFDPAVLRDRTGAPVEVALAPAGTVVIELDDTVPDHALPVHAIVHAKDRKTEFDRGSHPQASEFVAQLAALVTTLALESEEGARRAALSILRGDLFADGLPPLEGAPDMSLFETSRRFELNEPRTLFDDVPAGRPSYVSVRSDGYNVGVEPRTLFHWLDHRSDPFELERGGSFVATVVGLGAASIQGSIPLGAADGRFTLKRGEIANSSRREREGAIDASGAFVIENITPTDYQLKIEWTGADGIEFLWISTFALAPDEVRDLGTITVDGGFAVTFVPQIFVDGVELTRLEGTEFDGLSWSASCSPWRPQGDGLRSSTYIRSRALAPVTTGGIPAGMNMVQGGTHPAVELPADIADRYRLTSYEAHRDVNVSADFTTPVTIHIDSAAELVVEVVVPPSTDGTPHSVLGVAYRPEDGQIVQFAFPKSVASSSTTDWTCEGRATLTTGDWQIIVSAHPTGALPAFVPGETTLPMSWFGRAEARVDRLGEVRATVRLTPAAALVVASTARVPNDTEASPNDAFAVAPADRTTARFPKMSGRADRNGWFVLLGLEPNTAYKDWSSSRTYTTSGPGDTAVVEH